MDGDAVIFGLTIAEFEDWSLKILLTALIVYMLFIIGNLAKQSKAGRYGTVWLFIALGLGFVGFVAKSFIQRFLGIE
ncbi:MULTISPECIES: DUF2788 domain-containing protein [Aromatoleum]|uniref:DUF2788 domain-containing protein n=2 Tax=Aromatoleum TaxID=551759 RepID=A0ABX1NSJ1_9RHOO|nr:MULTISPECIES: DUF2788 domain-containing protein [Aromatoleum]KON79989.1 DUF2788 domain-containing protein [Azoarcus sp. PA01]MCK0511260.1 DUF2788 domain-containing protein [Aromatoleum buckelii]NMG14641.1 DUF2788 domain-containing protein [Aromatoleum bremense]QTQ30513.1 putative protein DUf2788 [Aromatoleum bremense]